MNIPHEDVARACEAMSDEGLARAARHVGVPATLPRGELVARLVASGLLLGCTHGMSRHDLRAFASALGLSVDASATEQELRGRIFAHDRWHSPGETDRRAKRAQLGPMSMTLGTLLAEGRALARSVVHLTPDPLSGRSEPVAFWCEEDVDDDDGERRWLRVDLSAHPDPACRASAVLEVHVDVGKGQGRAAVVSSALEGRTGGIPLFPRDVKDLPEIDVVLARGGEPIRRWLEENRWDPSWGYNDNFPDAEVARAYQRAWAEEHPLATGRAWAQLGGWPLGWGEETARDQLSRSLVLRTYRGAEPWLEVSRVRDAYRVAVRIT